MDVEVDGCFSFKRFVESLIYKRKPYSFIGINIALEDFETSQWAVCALGVGFFPSNCLGFSAKNSNETEHDKF